MLVSTQPGSWKALDHELQSMDLVLSLISATRPKKLKKEHRKFFSSASYEPQFEYPVPPKELEEFKKRLLDMKIDLDTALGILFEEKRLELLQKIEVVEAIGNDAEFPIVSERYFGRPPEAVTASAEALLKNLMKPPLLARVFTVEEVAEQLKTFLQKQGLPHWKIRIRKRMVARCALAQRHTILLRARGRYSERGIQKLIAHEVETHIYCRENGKLQPYPFFERGLAHHLRTQEGLAIYHQNQVVSDGLRDALITFQAVTWARSMGFRAVYQHLLAFVPPQKAWRLTVKVKRGLKDTGKPGAFMKNALYYWGYCEVDQYVKNGGNFEDLFMGKFGLHQLPLIKTLPGIVPPRYLPAK